MTALKNSELPVINPSPCEGCGACCMHMGHPTFLLLPCRPALSFDEGVYAQMPRGLREELEEYIADLDDDDYGEPCCWLDLETKRCNHYEHRPQVCRDFEVGGDGCLRWIARRQLERLEDLSTVVGCDSICIEKALLELDGHI